MVSFIILNYNTSQECKECVKSIRRFIPKGTYEIIIVDNNSRFDDKTCIQDYLHDDIKLVESKFNGGFGLGNMLGANVAKGDYLCFLNSDVIFTEDCISPLCYYIENHSDVGCITPQQYDFNNNFVPSFRHNPCFLRELIGVSFLEKHFPRHYPNRRKKWKEPIEVPQINGCFMLFPSKCFYDVGGFDTNIFLYDEECDIGYRLKRMRMKCVVYPDISFLHKGATTTKCIYNRTYRERYISRMYVYRKHHSYWNSLMYRIMLIVFTLFKPKKWYLFPILLRGEALSQSMRHNSIFTNVY